MYPFNDDWTNSLFFSQDPVAIDSVMYDFLHTEGPIPIEGSQNYLHQAAEPPLNTYDPEQDGIYISNSLGIHEHWNHEESVFSSSRYVGIDFVTLGSEYATPAIVMEKPIQGGLYVFDEYTSFRILFKDFYTFPWTIAIGALTVNVTANGEYADLVDSVTFQVDDTLVFTDDIEPYSWKWESFSVGVHTLTVTAYDDAQMLSSTSRSVFKIL
jgi:hypothetical protein